MWGFCGIITLSVALDLNRHLLNAHSWMLLQQEDWSLNATLGKWTRGNEPFLFFFFLTEVQDDEVRLKEGRTAAVGRQSTAIKMKTYAGKESIDCSADSTWVKWICPTPHRPHSPLHPRPASAASLAPRDSEGSSRRKLHLGNVKACTRVWSLVKKKKSARSRKWHCLNHRRGVSSAAGRGGGGGGCSNSNPWVMAGSYFPSIVLECLRITKRK